MSTPSLASAGLRPATLPPTLQPHAIAAMAPPPSRALSALLAGGLYILLAGGGLLAVRLMPEKLLAPLRPTEPETVVERVVSFTPDPPMAAPAQPPVGPAAASSDAPVLPPLAVPAVPDAATPVAPGDGPPVTGLTTSPWTGVQGPSSVTTGPSDSHSTPTGQHSGVHVLAAASVRVLSQVQPVYPTLARVTRIQGPVVLRMTIDAQGVPTDVQVASGPSALQMEAVRAARLWRFVPATVNGLAVPAAFQLTINFTLR